MQVHHRGRWEEPAAWERHKYTHCLVRWKDYQLVRVETCNDPACKSCVGIHNRGTKKRRPYYTPNFDHYRLTKPGKWELYNFVEDPFQDRDLAEEKPEIVKQMANRYEAWWEEVSPTLEAAAAKAAAKGKE